MLNESPCTLISFEIKYENMNEVLPGTSQTNTGYMKKKMLGTFIPNISIHNY